MRRAATYLIAASLTVGSILPVAAQERPRSAPPSRGSTSGESKGGSATSGSNQNRGGERQADRREAGPSQSQAPRNDSRTFSGPSRPSGGSRTQARSNDSRGNDVRRGVKIMLAGGFKGTFALEYEAGPLNGVEGAKYLYQEVLAALRAEM